MEKKERNRKKQKHTKITKNSKKAQKQETTGSNLGFKNLVRSHATHAIGELKNQPTNQTNKQTNHFQFKTPQLF